MQSILVTLALMMVNQQMETAPTPPVEVVVIADTLAQPPADSRRALWQNVRYGMNRAEINALYPASDSTEQHPDRTELNNVVIVGQCKANVDINFTDGLVETVVVKGDSSLGGRCSDTVLTALSARYGQPLAREGTEGSILAREGRVYVWIRDGVTLRYKRFSNGIFSGGGLMARSWELTYSTVADDVAL